MVKKGSALLIVMIVIASVVAATFGIQRIALIELSNSTKGEDNVLALAAARSGINDGLLRYRFERNVSTGDNIDRFDLNTGVWTSIAKGTDISQVTNYKKDHQYYDLYINYLADRIDNKVIEKDDYLELTGFQNTGTYSLESTFTCTSGVGTVNVQKIKRHVLDGSQFSQEEQNIDLVSPTPGNVTMTIADGSDLATTIRIRPYKCTVNADFLISNGGKFDGLTTYVVSTGYYGDAKSTLIAPVDRKNGTVLGVFDFTLYGKTGIGN